MFSMTKHHIVSKSSDKAAAGFWEDFFWGGEGVECVCAYVLWTRHPPPPFTPSTSGARNVWSASYAGRLCQHSRQTEEGKEEEVGDREYKMGRNLLLVIKQGGWHDVKEVTIVSVTASIMATTYTHAQIIKAWTEFLEYHSLTGLNPDFLWQTCTCSQGSSNVQSCQLLPNSLVQNG